MSTRSMLAVVFVLVAALVLGRGAWFSSQASRLVEDESARAEHDVDLEQAVNQVALEATEMETGVRGWLVTGDPSFREPWVRARATVDASLDRLTKLVASDDEATRLAAVVKSRLATWVAEVATPLLALDRAAVATPSTEALEVEGKRQMDDLREAIARLRGRASALHREARAQVAETTRQARAHDLETQAGALLFIALLLLALSARIDRPLARLAEAAKTMELAALAGTHLKATTEVQHLAGTLASFASQLMTKAEDDRRLSDLRGLFSSSKDAAALGRDALALIAGHQRATAAVLWVAGGADRPLAPLAVFGLDASRLPVEAPATVRDVRASRQAVRLSDGAPAHLKLETAFAAVSPKSVLVLPVIALGAGGETVVGVVELASVESDALATAPTRELLSLGLALDKALATEQVEKLGRTLADERAQLESIIRALPDGLVVTGADRSIARANPASEALLGPLVGRSSEELQQRLRPVAAEAHPGEAPPDPSTAPVRVRMVDPGGQPRVVSLMMAPVLRADGTPTGQSVATMRDETREFELQQKVTVANEELRAQNEELRAQEEELRAQSVELARASGAKSEFLATMSHELRTPLNAILGFSELLLASPAGLDEETTRALGDIHAAGRQLLLLINEVLDLAKIEAGRLELHLSSVDVREPAEEALSFVAPAAKQKDVRIESSVPSGVFVRADSDRLRQVFANLLSNAVKFTPQGGHVRVTAVRDGEQLQVTVEDDGIGIPKSEQARLFEPFTQLESGSTRRYGGTGLGLAISRRLVTAMGGELGLDSEPGRGSRFFFRLGLSSGSSPEPVPATTPVERRRLLVVEDEEPARRMITGALASAGFEVEAAVTGEEALERFVRSPPAVMLVDLCLPGISGKELIEKIRARPDGAKVAIVVLTAMDLMPAERTSLEHLADLIVQKGAVSRGDFLVRLRSLGPSNGSASAHRLTILIVDDNELNRRVERAMVEGMGHDVIEASGGREAIERVLAEKPDVVLMDLEMPEVDGLEATRRLVADPRTASVPVVAVSAHAMAKDAQRAREAGCVAFVPKPVGRRQLAAALVEATTQPSRRAS